MTIFMARPRCWRQVGLSSVEPGPGRARVDEWVPSEAITFHYPGTNAILFALLSEGFKHFEEFSAVFLPNKYAF